MPPIIVDQHVTASRDKVWQALTDPQQMREWYFPQLPDFRPQQGFSTEFVIENEGRTFTHQWRVSEVAAPERIAYTWNFAEYEGQGEVIFELLPEGTGTRVRVTNTGLETFPSDVPEFRPESCRGGWEYFIQGNLKDYLNGKKPYGDPA